MYARKKVIDPKNALQLLAGCGSLERAPSRSWLQKVFGFLFQNRTDLTREIGRELEQKRTRSKLMPAPLRETYFQWHI